MASLKVKFRPSVKEDREGTIYYQIIHNRIVRQLKTDYKIYNGEWNELTSEIVISFHLKRRESYLLTIKERVKFETRRLNQITKGWDRRDKQYSVDDIIAAYNKYPKGHTLFKFMQEVIIRLRNLDKIRTSETYVSALNSVSAFTEGEDISMDMVDSDLMENYEAYLKRKGSSLNTISFYMRILRAVYNRAVDKDIIEQRYPFKHVYTSVDKTTKRAISLSSIKHIKELELTHLPVLEFARDIFLFSFYTRGMSFVDIAYLRKADIKNRELTYRRRKTGQKLHIKWEKCMNELVKKYSKDTIEFLLPIIVNPNICLRKQYIAELGRINSSLKKVAVLANLQSNLTMYVARHSWASAARSKNIPISVICEGMGHDSEATTQIYLASLDTAIVDKANRLILRSI